VVEGTDFVKVQRLSSIIRFKKLNECQFVVGGTKTLIQDLAKAGLIEE